MSPQITKSCLFTDMPDREAGFSSTLAGKYSKPDIDRTLKYCLENKITKATDFEPVLLTLASVPAEPVNGTNKRTVIDKKRYQIYPQKSSISDYKQILN